MRHRTATILLAACLLPLTACSGGSDKTDAKPSPTKTVSKEDTFLNAVHAAHIKSWTDKGPIDAELVVYPPEWCKGLDAGHSVKWLFTMFGDGGGAYPIGNDWGTYKTDANAVLVMGVKAYCPANLPAVREELRASGEY
ncbi:MAG TPA: hypothetical protein VIQ25_00255 [Gemmatimonadales bacterium]|jgi:hypothetical protein|nr:hypothetical protein [Gemmatimonadales bacterium]